MNDEAMNQCMKNCNECSEICMKTIMHCLQKGGDHASPEHIRLMMDCAEICKMSASFMARGSDHAGRIAEICAEICEKCAESCEAMADDSEMARCADICRQCAESCRSMVNA